MVCLTWVNGNVRLFQPIRPDTKVPDGGITRLLGPILPGSTKGLESMGSLDLKFALPIQL
jgi:hypothetical protein